MIDILSRIGGFRNIIVHEYLGIDPGLVRQAPTSGLGDLEVFATHIVDYLRREGYLED